MDKLAKTQEDVCDADVSAPPQSAGEVRSLRNVKHSASTAPVFAVSSSVAGSSRPGEQYRDKCSSLQTAATLWVKSGLLKIAWHHARQNLRPCSILWCNDWRKLASNCSILASRSPSCLHDGLNFRGGFKNTLYTCTCRELRTATCTSSRRVFRSLQEEHVRYIRKTSSQSARGPGKQPVVVTWTTEKSAQGQTLLDGDQIDSWPCLGCPGTRTDVTMMMQEKEIKAIQRESPSTKGGGVPPCQSANLPHRISDPAGIL